VALLHSYLMAPVTHFIQLNQSVTKYAGRLIYEPGQTAN
jgi:hypothetical protein